MFVSMKTTIFKRYQQMHYQFLSIENNDDDDCVAIRVHLEIRTLAFVFNES